jgi:hypothetical protein
MDRIYHLHSSDKYRPPQADGRMGTGQGRGVKEPAASGEPRPVEAPRPSTNDMARRGMLLASIGQLADHQPPLVDADDLRLALLSERVGEVGAAYWRGHTDIEGELQKVAATALAWLEAIQRDRAR